ncbi:MAG TPA: hypothetical protein VNP72_04400 [Longimicrobium sp.]|nr:hypothetical protein [Longimicrobium sp.]
MLIPRFWSRAESQAMTPAGKAVRFHVWRGSRSSAAEAQAAADEAVRRIADRIALGQGFPERYAYGDRPLREEVVREFPAGGAETPDAALTRNAYGALVLNASRAFFIDVDVAGSDAPARAASSAPRASSSSTSSPNPLWGLINMLPVPGAVRSVLEGVLGPSEGRPETAAPAPTPAGAPPVSGGETAALGRLRSWIAAHPEWRVRVYRTHSGLRYLVTHALFSPTDAEAAAAMAALGADPQYIRLCQVQKSFRARLTPKPWRIGVENPPVTFPYESIADEQAMRDWEARYKQASSGRATAQLVEELGGGTEHPEITPIRALHDEHTRAESGLRLA